MYLELFDVEKPGLAAPEFLTMKFATSSKYACGRLCLWINA